MRQDFFQFVPVFKLMIAGNHKPRVRTIDEVMRRRLQMIPFMVTIAPEKRDKDLAEKLKAEWPAILRWMLDGCAMWQREGLNPPEAVLAATSSYLESEDTIATWLEERCEVSASFHDTSARLFASWKAWAELMGEPVGVRQQFAEKLEAMGMEQIRIGKARTRGFRGLHVVQAEPPQHWSDQD
jgi:P4 family phage/plasmid primase-like protien